MFIKLNNIDIFYNKYGEGSPLIMVHGNGENSTIFNKSIELLKNHFTVYTLDLRDHGKSSKVKTLHYEDHVKDIYEFIIKLDIKNPIFYGFSDGGIIGLMLAYKYPYLLSNLIISGANINPKGIKKSTRFLMWLGFVFTRSKKIKMMLKEPNIDLEDLHKIQVNTFITAGSNDVIYKSHTELILENIKNSSLKIYQNHNHSSYIVNSDIIARYILECVKT